MSSEQKQQIETQDPGRKAGERNSMLKMRFALLGALALFIASGISASVASAEGPYWHVGGAGKLAGVRQIKLQSKGPLFLKQGATLEIECQNSISEGGTIEGGSVVQGQAKGRTLYTQCTAPKPAGKCIVREGQIKTTQIKSYLAKAATQTGIVEVFIPTEGKVFTQFLLENAPGNTCTFKEVGATGSAAAEVIPAGVEGQEGLLAFPSTPILKVKHEGQEVTLPKLETVGAASTFSGTYAARLATFPEQFGVFET